MKPLQHQLPGAVVHVPNTVLDALEEDLESAANDRSELGDDDRTFSAACGV